MSADYPLVNCPNCQSCQSAPTGMQILFDRKSETGEIDICHPRSVVYQYKCVGCGHEFRFFDPSEE